MLSNHLEDSFVFVQVSIISYCGSNVNYYYNYFVLGANIFLSSDGYIKLGDFGSSIKLKDPFRTFHGEINNMRGTVGES